MKTPEAALTEWVNDSLTFWSCNKNWVLSRAQAHEIVHHFQLKHHLLFNDTVTQTQINSYEFFPTNILRDFFALLDRGAKITAQEFSQCSNLEDLRDLLTESCLAKERA